MGYNGNPSHVRIQSYHDYRHIFYIFIIILIPSDLTDLPSDLPDLPSDLTDLPSDLTDLPSDLTDLPSDLTDLPSDLPTHHCHYCLHIQYIRRINQHYAELTFSPPASDVPPSPVHRIGHLYLQPYVDSTFPTPIMPNYLLPSVRDATPS